MKLGAHISIKGGYIEALKKAKELELNSLQLFSYSPLSWNLKPLTVNYDEFKRKSKELEIPNIYFHAPYLINLAGKDRVVNLSKKALINELQLASKLEIKGSVIHLGSFGKNKKESNYYYLLKNIEEVLKNIPNNVTFIIENSAVRKIGRDLNEIYRIIKDLKDKRVKICLDTCHLFAAGYSIHTKEGLEKLLTNLDKNVGIDKLEVIHINDSKDPFGSLRDRHENIGKGYIGLTAFKRIINHPLLFNLPFILETPGFKKDSGESNIRILKKLRKEV